MIGELTRSERWVGLTILLVLAVCGLTLAAAGHDDPLGGQGWIILLAALAGVVWVVRHYDDAAPVRHV